MSGQPLQPLHLLVLIGDQHRWDALGCAADGLEPWQRTYQQRLFDGFGPRRLMWGSNWPMQVPKVSHQSRLDAVRRDLPACTALGTEDQVWVLGGTARSLWSAAGVVGA